MIIDAHAITDLQACPRRTLLSSDYEVLKWRPKSLFDACLRRGIARVSKGDDLAVVATDAKTDFLQVAANPGLDLPYGADSYRLARDWTAMLDTILRAAARWSLPALTLPPVVELDCITFWRPLAFVDAATGELHRFVTVDRWGDADLSRELHSWYVSGEISVARRPMTIHVIAIGQVRDGRRASPWARGWKHPTMPSLRMRFLRRDRSALKGWKPVYLADMREADPADWVESMYKEGTAQGLLHTVPIEMPSERQAADTVKQILREAGRLDALVVDHHPSAWRDVPMSRGACDGMTPCEWQNVCHGDIVNIDEIGLYRRREAAYAVVGGGRHGT